jgi:hypothetical protein
MMLLQIFNRSKRFAHGFFFFFYYGLLIKLISCSWLFLRIFVVNLLSLVIICIIDCEDLASFFHVLKIVSNDN